MKQLPLHDFEKQEIKSKPITPDQLDSLKKIAGTYEVLFSTRAMKFKSMGLNATSLDESDYRKLIIQEYTFLKRPVFIVDDRMFIGNSIKVVEELKGVIR